ncbi:hypothetical protein LCGC14_1948570, partial [marine sediment metagenome]
MKSSPLYPYMERVDNFTKDKPQIGMFVFYGGGKTYMSLKWLERLYEAQRPIFPVLVITMGTLINQWGTEITKHCSRKFSLIQGNTNNRLKALESYAEIYVLNYDIIRSPKVRYALEHLHFRTVIADESVMLKEARTARFKAWRKILKATPFRALLTAKPIMEYTTDIWAQMLFLDGGRTLGTSFWAFRYKYFDPGPPWDPYKWTLKEGAGETIAKLLNHTCIQIKQEEIADQLPPRIPNPVYFKMPSATQKLYKELNDEFAVTLPSGHKYETKWAMGKASKMHQLCQGFMYLSAWKDRWVYDVGVHAILNGTCYICNEKHRSSLDNKPPYAVCWTRTEANWEDIDHVKLNWLEENLSLIVDSGPVLVWSCFKAMQYRIAKLLGKMGMHFGCIRSKLTQQERTAVVNGFNSGSYDILLLAQQVAAPGLNLQRANHAIFTCTDFKAALRENAEMRCLRLGSEIHECITYTDLLMENSIDTIVQEAIRDKLDVAEQVLKYLQ